MKGDGRDHYPALHEALRVCMHTKPQATVDLLGVTIRRCVVCVCLCVCAHHAASHRGPAGRHHHELCVYVRACVLAVSLLGVSPKK
eukprot:915194-Pelagomonas_calceolata.AAC.2